MYIVLRPNISPSVATIAVAHGALGAYLKWQNDQVVKDWASGQYGPFYKVICQATDFKHFETCKTLGEHIVITESKLDNLETCIVYKPVVWTKSHIFNELQLYKG